MKGFCPLASGSKGNCIYFGSGETKLLIDAGISASEVVKRLSGIGVDIQDIDAILITHEHSDHIKGLENLSSKYRIPVLANSETASSIQAQLKRKLAFKIFTTGESFTFGDIDITPFSIQHDAVEPVAFILQTMGLKCGFCTDLGFVTTLVVKKLSYCDFLFIEANHNVNMVHASARPEIYKERVLSRQGHLSNEECAELIEKVLHDKLRHIHLAHLSSECNAPELALKVVQERLSVSGVQVEVHIAKQDELSHPIHFPLEVDLKPVMGHPDLTIDAAMF